jgi:hypothetical protein
MHGPWARCSRTWTAVALVAAFALAPASASRAQGSDARLNRYLGSQEYANIVVSRALEADRLRKTGCDQPKALRHTLQNVLEAPRFAADSNAPVAGVWIDRVDIDRCGTTIAENMLVIVDKGTMNIARLLPGITKAGPLLQRDAMQPALAAATVKKDKAEKAGPKPCPDREGVTVADTSFLRERIPIVNDAAGRMTAGAWDETWIFLFCAQEIPVLIHFDADGNGGTNFTVDPSE